MIIGVALVVNELHKGERLVLRYPESVPSNVLNANPELLKFHEDYHALSPDNFAKLFRPKASLYNKVLEITIDDIRYLSFPCPCSEEHGLDLPGQNRTDAITLFNVVIATVRESAIQRILDSLDRNDKTPQIRELMMKNGGCACENDVGMDPIEAAFGLRKNGQTTSSRILRRVVESISRALLHQEKRHRYVSNQVAQIFRLQEAGVAQPATANATQMFQTPVAFAASSGAAAATSGDLILSRNESVNVVISGGSSGTNLQFPLSSSDRVPSTKDSSSSTSSYGQIPGAIDPDRLLAMATNSNGTSAISQAIDRTPSISSVSAAAGTGAVGAAAVGQIQSSTLSQHNSSGGSSQPANTNDGARENLHVMETVLQQSSLANELRQVYHGLIGGLAVNMMVNSAVSVSVRLSNDGCEKCRGSDWSNRVTGGENRGLYTGSTGGDELVGDNSGFLTLLTASDPAATLSVLWMLEANAVGNAAVAGSASWSSSIGHGGSSSNAARSSSSSSSSSLVGGLDARGDDAAKNLQSAAAAASSLVHPELRKIVSLADPTKSLEELSVLMEQPLQEVRRIAKHLCDWGLARMIPTVTADRRYKPHPRAPLEESSKAGRAFYAAFAEVLTLAAAFDIAYRDELKSAADSAKRGGGRSRSGSAAQAQGGAAGGGGGGADHLHSPVGSPPAASEVGNAASAAAEPPHAISPAVAAARAKASLVYEGLLNSSVKPFPMSRVLAVFDGNRTLEQAIRRLPNPLQPYGVDMVVWLLRRRMLVEVHRYILSIEDVEEEHILLIDENGEKHERPTAHTGTDFQDISVYDDGVASSVASSVGADYSRSFDAAAAHDSSTHSLHSYSSPSRMKPLSRRNSDGVQVEGGGLGRYLDGQSAMHEILWHENVTEEEVLNFVKSNESRVVFHCS